MWFLLLGNFHHHPQIVLGVHKTQQISKIGVYNYSKCWKSLNYVIYQCQCIVRINQFQAMDASSRSRLSSITEQSHEAQHLSKTVHQLLYVYYELYALNYVARPAEPRNIFNTISANIQSRNPSFIFEFMPFSDRRNEEESRRQAIFLKESGKQPLQKSRILSKQQLSARIKERLSQSPTQKLQKQEQFVQTVAQSRRSAKQLEDTADSNISIPEILDKLNEFDEERTEIKFQIYAEDCSKVDHLYVKWSDLHRRMKEVLEIYINKIGNGKSLLEIYREMNKLKNNKSMIEGFTQKQLLSKLDTYIQSLFLDEREILLHRSSMEKSRTASNPALSHHKNPRKKLYFT